MDKDHQIKLLATALQNMVGVFDTPVARMKIGGDFAEAARESARDALKEVGYQNPSVIS